MAKIKITDMVKDILKPYLEQENLVLWNVEFVKEVKDWFLRVYIDNENKPISIDECEKASRYLSERLDEIDTIEQKYYLEVSSPGMDRELITEEHYKKYIGSLVDMKLYKAIDNQKLITAKLENVDEENYYLQKDNGYILQVPKSQVAKTKLTVVF